MTTNDQVLDRPTLPATALPDRHATGTRAVITIAKRLGSPRAFRSTWASPEYLIPAFAHFLTWVDAGRHRLTVQTWLAYADVFPGTLPCEDVDDTVGGDALAGDVDYRYRLDLDADAGAVLLRVYSLRGLARQPRPRLVFELTRANLFAEAAVLCNVLADRAQQWADSHDGAPPPGNDPEVWRRHEARFRRIHATTAVTALASNFAAQYAPATFDTPYPAIQVAGAWVVAGVDQDGTLRIAARLDRAERWLLRPDGTVPLRVSVHDTVVFDA
jgi:hypothetical protein